MPVWKVSVHPIIIGLNHHLLWPHTRPYFCTSSTPWTSSRCSLIERWTRYKCISLERNASVTSERVKTLITLYEVNGASSWYLALWKIGLQACVRPEMRAIVILLCHPYYKMIRHHCLSKSSAVKRDQTLVRVPLGIDDVDVSSNARFQNVTAPLLYSGRWHLFYMNIAHWRSI